MEVRSLFIVSFTLGVIWFLLFPLVSISTGELKPRSVYIDENSILLPSSSQRKLRNPGACHLIANSSSLCDFDPSSRISCHSHLSFPVDSVSLLLDSGRHVDTKESIVLVFASNAENASLMYSLACRLIDDILISKWISRRIIFMFHLLPASCPSVSTCSVNYSNWIESLNTSVLFAVVVDLTHSSSSVPSVNGIDLKLSGFNGNLPNMDLVSSVISFDQGVYVDGISQNVAHNDERFETFFSDYANRLLGMARFLSRLSQGASGRHGVWLARDVDALSVDLTYLGMKPSQESIDGVFKILRELVRVSSNIHEKLHHSYRLYILLGGGFFAGHGEYGIFPPLLLSLPLFLELYKAAAQLNTNQSGYWGQALADLFRDIVPVFCTLCLVRRSSVLLNYCCLELASLIPILFILVRVYPSNSERYREEKQCYFILSLSVVLCALCALDIGHLALAVYLLLPIHFVFVYLLQSYNTSSISFAYKLVVGSIISPPFLMHVGALLGWPVLRIASRAQYIEAGDWCFPAQVFIMQCLSTALLRLS